MGVGWGGQGVPFPPWILKLIAKNIIFSISRGKKQISPLLAPPWKNLWENPLLAPLEKVPPTPVDELVEQQVKMDVLI